MQVVSNKALDLIIPEQSEYDFSSFVQKDWGFTEKNLPKRMVLLPWDLACQQWRALRPAKTLQLQRGTMRVLLH